MLKAIALALAALLIPSPAMAQQGERFVYLGRTANFAVFVTDASGPRTERRLTIIAANRSPSGPLGANVATMGLVIDCEGNTLRGENIVLHLDGDELGRETAVTPPVPPSPNSPQQLAFRFACMGETPPGEPVWINGQAAVRERALVLVKAK